MIHFSFEPRPSGSGKVPPLPDGRGSVKMSSSTAQRITPKASVAGACVGGIRRSVKTDGHLGLCKDRSRVGRFFKPSWLAENSGRRGGASARDYGLGAFVPGGVAPPG